MRGFSPPTYLAGFLPPALADFFMTYFDDFYITTQVLPTISLWHIVNTSAVTSYQKNIARGLLASGLHLP
jgi:hypothetical protein